MNDKIVTHEDLDVLRALREETCTGPTCTCPGSNLLDRLIAAAEADQPPLPEGWVLRHGGAETYQALYHKGDGKLCMWTKGAPVGLVGDPGFTRDRLTPLRPTVTEADVEKAADATADYRDDDWSWNELIRRAFKAAGVEVQP